MKAFGTLGGKKMHISSDKREARDRNCLTTQGNPIFTDKSATNKVKTDKNVVRSTSGAQHVPVECCEQSYSKDNMVSHYIPFYCIEHSEATSMVTKAQ